MTYCCADLEEVIEDGIVQVIHSKEFEYDIGIPAVDLMITHCPWCGKKLNIEEIVNEVRS